MTRLPFRARLLALAVLAPVLLVLGLVGACGMPRTYAPNPAHVPAPPTPVLPPPGVYRLDPLHSFVYFSARHHVVGVVRGRFDQVAGTLTVGEDAAACKVEVTLDTASISTQAAERDQALRGPGYLDAEHFPKVSYVAQGFRAFSRTSGRLDGLLTVHGVTLTVPLSFTYHGVMGPGQPGRPVRVAFHGTASTRRAPFGVGTQDNLEELGLLTTPDVHIEVDVEAEAL